MTLRNGDVKMSLIINLDPTDEQRLANAARQIGIAPAEYVARLVRDSLPFVAPDISEQDPMLALFDQWKEEDAEMSAEELQAEQQSWEELKTNINAERKRAGARPVF
jgi:hypothetical protein